MEIRQAQGADWEALRRLRLGALADAPDAFASTLEREVAFPAEAWRQRAQGGPGSANFIAREGGVDIGGLRPTGERQPLPSNPARTESLLRLPVAGSLQAPGQETSSSS
jgi:hypothetical protein